MAELVASILCDNAEQVARDARRAAMAGAHWVELRLDRWPGGRDFEAVFADIDLPILVACRTVADGGYWDGSSQDRRDLLNGALKAGALGLDLEDWEEWAPPAGQNRLRLLVRSHHDLKGVPADLDALHRRLGGMRGNVVKIAAMAHDFADAAPLLELQAGVGQQVSTAAFAMGPTAWPARILSALLGAPLVYGSVDEHGTTAPGQLPIRTLRQLYRAHEIGPQTELFGLLGNPAYHSLGPLLHNRRFRELQRDALYLPFESSRPAAVMAMLPKGQLRGLSVTAPFKEAMAGHAHRLAQDASTTDVVNTLVFEGHGMVVGHNTDVAGVTGALVGAGVPTPRAGTVGVVLGAGGAARAGAVALAELGFEVVMLARTLDPAREFTRRHEFRLGALKADILAELDPAVVIHATPVGSEAADPGGRILPDWRPKEGVYVLDMVYRPVWTPLLREVRAAGGVPIPGVEMFLAQAAAQCELFSGERPGPNDLRRYLDL